MRYGALRFAAAIFITLVASCLVSMTNAYAADSFSWSSGMLLTATEDADEYTGLDELGRPDWGGGCTYRDVLVGNLATTPSSVCVFQGEGFRYGVLLEPVYFGSFVTYNRSFVISFSNDTRMYKVQDAPTHRILWIPYSSNIVYRTGSVSHDWDDFIVIKNIRSKLVPIINPDFSRGYRLIGNSSQLLISDEHGEGTPVGAVAASNNGRWAVAQIHNKGIVRINLRDFTKVWFSDYHPDEGIEGVLPEFAVSDDGQHVAVVGNQVEPFMVDLSSGCGQSITVFNHNWTQLNGQSLPGACPERQIRAALEGSASGSLDVARRPSFDRTGNKLLVHITTKPSEVIPSRHKDVSVSSSSYYDDNPRLEYLALGDSYSSGEGDIQKRTDGQSFYLPGTNINQTSTMPSELCHISSRSYPFLLRNSMSLSVNKMRSVACSGAVTYDIYANSGEYFGQGRRLASLPISSRLTMQTQAVVDFIPGRVEQINFVEKYKPSAVTLTIGGNDTGFGSVIENCARSLETCAYANKNGLRGHQGYLIRSQFEAIKKTVNDIRRVSPLTKVYLIGYPEFMYGGMAVCGLNAGILDSNERTMIVKSIEYLNDVIEAAARASGAMYIDIQNSLAGGRICELGGYVTGVVDVRFSGVSQSATFHPNARGHVKIANAIESSLKGANLLTYPYAKLRNLSTTPPAPIEYFADAMKMLGSRVIQYSKSVTNSVVVKSQLANINISAYALMPGSSASYTIYSEPTHLGSFTVDQEGGYEGGVVIPSSLSAGYHTLVISGETYSGESIDLYENVLVIGTNPDDIDEDNIIDSLDKCLFMPSSDIDSDNDGLDDACDPEVDQHFTGFISGMTRATLNQTQSEGLSVEKQKDDIKYKYDSGSLLVNINSPSDHGLPESFHVLIMKITLVVSILSAVTLYIIHKLRRRP